MGDIEKTLKPLETALMPLAGVIPGKLKDILGGGPDVPAAQTAPTPDDATARAAKEREMQRKYAKSGRAGTMLTNTSGTLG